MVARWIPLVAVSLLVSPVLSDPIQGTYTPSDGVLPGGASESFVGSGSSEPDNVVVAASWDGSVLGTQWVLDGAVVESDTLVYTDTYPDGGGVRVFSTVYDVSGATLALLEAPGLWTAGGDGNYVVDLTFMTQETSVFVDADDQVVRSSGQVSMQGQFVGFPGYALSYLTADFQLAGEGSSPPAGYPALSEPSGLWADISEVHLRIVPEPMTGALLGIGGLLLARRRRR